MAKRKKILHLADGEIAVVWPIEYWKHLVVVYESLGEECTDAIDRAEWFDAAQYVKECIEAADAGWNDE